MLCELMKCMGVKGFPSKSQLRTFPLVISLLAWGFLLQLNFPQVHPILLMHLETFSFGTDGFTHQKLVFRGRVDLISSYRAIVLTIAAMFYFFCAHKVLQTLITCFSNWLIKFRNFKIHSTIYFQKCVCMLSTLEF